MAAISRSRRSAAGISFIVGGVLLLLAVLFGQTGSPFGTWPTVLAYLAFAVGFIVLAVGSIANLIARIALIVAGAGWAVLALSSFVAMPGELVTIAAVAAALGGVVGAIVLYVGKEITDRSAIAFIVTTVAAAIMLLVSLGNAALAILVTVLVGAGFVLTGVLFHWVQRRRR